MRSDSYEFKSEKNCYDSFICCFIVCSNHVDSHSYSWNRRIYPSGVILGPVYGLLAGGIGSAMADLIGGYFIYVPITFVIKGLVALAAGLIYQKLGHSSKTRFTAVILGGVADIVLVAGGYCLCEIFLYGASGALASVPANIIQGVGGLIISAILYPALIAIPDVRQLAGERAHS